MPENRVMSDRPQATADALRGRREELRGPFNPSPLALSQPPGRELELKFLADEKSFAAAQQWDALGDVGQGAQPVRLRAVYFDTEARDLEQHRMSLRVREHRNRHTLTLKWNGNFAGGHFERGEVEVPIASAEPDLTLLGESLAAEIGHIVEGKHLQPVFETDIRRLAHRIRFDGSDIEVDFDDGVIVAGEQQAPAREIELELKSGTPAALYRLGLSLAESYPVRLGVLNKSDRGAALSSGTQPPVVRTATTLVPGQSVDDAISTVISSCVGHFMANWPAHEDGDAAEAVHQMRIAMRRLRSALALFHHELPGAEFVEFGNQSRRIASAMGEARNWDVFAELLEHGPFRAFPDVAGFAELLAASRQPRRAGHEAVAALLADPGVTRFVLGLHAFVADRGWRNGATGSEPPRADEDASLFAARNLERLHKRVVKRGRNLREQTPDERHELRIELKKLRYAVDAFAGLFPEASSARGYIRAAGKLQESLGRANDMQMAIKLARRLDTGGDSAAERAIGMMLGWCGHGAMSNGADLRYAWNAFKHTVPFWRGVLPEVALACPAS
jgi:inorganic triphosphatase YgiF